MLTQFAVLGFELIHALLLFDDLLCYVIKRVFVHSSVFLSHFSVNLWLSPVCVFEQIQEKIEPSSSITETNEFILWGDTVKCLEFMYAKYMAHSAEMGAPYCFASRISSPSSVKAGCKKP